METIFIDAKKSLNQNSILQFKENQSDDVNVVMYIESSQQMFEKPMRELRAFFEDDEIEKYVQSDDDVISFITDDKVLQILGLDYLWWIAVVRNKKRRRLDRLFSENQRVEQKQVKKNDNFVKCACAIKNDEQLTDIETFEGTKKECVAFVNKSYQIRSIRSMFKANIVFNVNYKFDEELNDMSKWKTFDELVNEGVFVE